MRLFGVLGFANMGDTDSTRIESVLQRDQEVRVFKEEGRDLPKLFEEKVLGVGIVTVTLSCVWLVARAR